MRTLTVARERFGTLAGGEVVDLAVMSSAAGLQLSATSYGAIITSIRSPDRRGDIADVSLGYDTLEPYLTDRAYLGACIGRYANRIANGEFRLHGRRYHLATNNGSHHLHGGPSGFHTRLWGMRLLDEPDRVAIEFSRVSPDGEEGYPGRLDVRVTYALHQDGDVVLDYEATAHAATVANLTQHTYFNLAGTGLVLDHDLVLDADYYTPVAEGLIPTGEIAPVASTPFDFRTPTPIGARLTESSAQLERGRGYDHNWVVRRAGDGLVRASRVIDSHSGRTLETFTTEPGVQFYAGQLLDGTAGRHGEPLRPHSGFCLETQHFPDAPNHEQFPSTVVGAGQKLQSRTVWRFGVS